MYDKRMIVSNFDVPDVLAFFKDRDIGDLTPTNIAWAAGFLEGEGCFGRYKVPYKRGKDGAFHGGGYTAKVHAIQVLPEPLERLRDVFGLGSIRSFTKADRPGKTYHQWHVNGHAAIAVMRVVEPLMCSRRHAKIGEIVAAHEEVQTRRRAKRENPLCANGHPWSENIAFRTQGVGKGVRYCRACQREYMRRSRAKKYVALAQ